MTMLQWVNEERTVLVRWFVTAEGEHVHGLPVQMEVASRPEPAASWGPPVKVKLEAPV